MTSFLIAFLAVHNVGASTPLTDVYPSCVLIPGVKLIRQGHTYTSGAFTIALGDEIDVSSPESDFKINDPDDGGDVTVHKNTILKASAPMAPPSGGSYSIWDFEVADGSLTQEVGVDEQRIKFKARAGVARAGSTLGAFPAPHTGSYTYVFDMSYSSFLQTATVNVSTGSLEVINMDSGQNCTLSNQSRTFVGPPPTNWQSLG